MVKPPYAPDTESEMPANSNGQPSTSVAAAANSGSKPAASNTTAPVIFTYEVPEPVVCTLEVPTPIIFKLDLPTTAVPPPPPSLDQVPGSQSQLAPPAGSELTKPVQATLDPALIFKKFLDYFLIVESDADELAPALENLQLLYDAQKTQPQTFSFEAPLLGVGEEGPRLQSPLDDIINLVAFTAPESQLLQNNTPKERLLRFCHYIVLLQPQLNDFVTLLLTRKVISYNDFFQELGYDPQDAHSLLILPDKSLLDIGVACKCIGATDAAVRHLSAITNTNHADYAFAQFHLGVMRCEVSNVEADLVASHLRLAIMYGEVLAIPYYFAKQFKFVRKAGVLARAVFVTETAALKLAADEALETVAPTQDFFASEYFKFPGCQHIIADLLWERIATQIQKITMDTLSMRDEHVSNAGYAGCIAAFIPMIDAIAEKFSLTAPYNTAHQRLLSGNENELRLEMKKTLAMHPYAKYTHDQIISLSSALSSDCGTNFESWLAGNDIQAMRDATLQHFLQRTLQVLLSQPAGAVDDAQVNAARARRLITAMNDIHAQRVRALGKKSASYVRYQEMVIERLCAINESMMRVNPDEHYILFVVGVEQLRELLRKQENGNERAVQVHTDFSHRADTELRQYLIKYLHCLVVERNSLWGREFDIALLSNTMSKQTSFERMSKQTSFERWFDPDNIDDRIELSNCYIRYLCSNLLPTSPTNFIPDARYVDSSPEAERALIYYYEFAKRLKLFKGQFYIDGQTFSLEKYYGSNYNQTGYDMLSYLQSRQRTLNAALSGSSLDERTLTLSHNVTHKLNLLFDQTNRNLRHFRLAASEQRATFKITNVVLEHVEFKFGNYRPPARPFSLYSTIDDSQFERVNFRATSFLSQELKLSTLVVKVHFTECSFEGASMNWLNLDEARFVNCNVAQLNLIDSKVGVPTFCRETRTNFGVKMLTYNMKALLDEWQTQTEKKQQVDIPKEQYRFKDLLNNIMRQLPYACLDELTSLFHTFLIEKDKYPILTGGRFKMMFAATEDPMWSQCVTDFCSHILSIIRYPGESFLPMVPALATRVCDTLCLAQKKASLSMDYAAEVQKLFEAQKLRQQQKAPDASKLAPPPPAP
jgi:uncharacterized protein YjbI with pentapeptide repeats